MLRKFTIQSVQKEESVVGLYSFGDWKEKHPQKRKEFHYTLNGNDGKTYFYHCLINPQHFTKGQTIRCWAKQKNLSEKDPKEFDIVFHSLYKRYIFSEYLFKKAVEDYIKKAEETIDWYKKEIERLKSLI